MFPRMQLLALLASVLLGFRQSACRSDMLSLRMMHRFSAEAHDFWSRKYAGSVSGERAAAGTPDFYRLLHRQDRRRLATTDEPLSFSSGNETMDYGEEFRWLHYAVIDIGTPNTSFLVALDTGSDLLWVPCECKQCASISASSQQLLDMPLNVYSPAASKTSKHVTCDNSLCDSSSTCESKSDDCLYNVQYVSDDTSTSGMLVEDVIHLTSGSHHGGPIETPVVLGCGQVQSGDFLNGGAPDGLLGLGFGEIALPNSLAKAGLVRNSFSMCFQADDSGRIFFGDKGLASQQTTPFLPLNGTHVRYVVGLDQISVGSKTFNRKGVNIIIDSGTSFTYLPMEMYSAVTTEFDIQVQQKRAVFEDVPWQFCYKTMLAWAAFHYYDCLSTPWFDSRHPSMCFCVCAINACSFCGSSNDDVPPPAISMVFHGGGNFSVFSPLIGIYSGNGTLDGFCLAILESSIAILGQSFMTGYQLVFDREDMKLGWSPSDCYKLEEGIGIDAAAPSDSLSPLTATPYTDAPSENAPAPFHGIPHSSGAGVSSREDSNAARHYKAHPLYTILSILFLNQVLHAQTMHHKSTNYNQVMS